MKSRLSERILVWTMLVSSIGGMTILGIWHSLKRAPSLEAIRILASQRQFRQAQSLLDRYLEVHPENTRAHLLMAEFTTQATNSHPDVAFRHLELSGRIRPSRLRWFGYSRGKRTITLVDTTERKNAGKNRFD